MENKDVIGEAMLPFTIRDLTDMVMKKKSLPLEDALHYIYSSELYKSILNEDTKLWYSSTLSLYELLEKEKAGQRKLYATNYKVLLFQVFCVENYRIHKNISAEDALHVFSEHYIFEFLKENFEMLHTQDLEYILDSITNYIKKL